MPAPRSTGLEPLPTVPRTKGISMKTSGLLRLLFLLALAALPAPVLALATPQEALQNTERLDGLLPVHVDRRGGRVLLSLPAPDAQGVAGRYIYVTSLETGFCSFLRCPAPAGGVPARAARSG